MKSYSRILVVLLLVTLDFSVSASTQCRGRTNRLLNRQLIGHVMSSQQCYDADDCMDQCIKSQQCYSINYHLNQKRCELNARTRLSHPLHLVPVNHVIYEDNPTRDYVACSDVLCNKMEVCHVTKGRPICSACSTAFGMESGQILDAALTASSEVCCSGREAFRARLNNQDRAGSSWAAGQNTPGEWLQVDLGEIKIVTKVATQGRVHHPQWVTSYKMNFSDDASNWETFKEHEVEKVFAGNSDRNTVVTHVLYPHPRARYVRIVVETFHVHMSLRAELYGCAQV